MQPQEHAVFSPSLAFMIFFLSAMAAARIQAADADGDGLDDAWEVSCGLNPARTTVLIYVDAANGADANTGRSAASAKASLGGALAVLQVNAENALMVAPGTYSGSANRGLSVSGADIKILRTGGGTAVFDLEGAGRLMTVTDSVFAMHGVTVRNGYAASGGTAVSLSGTSAVLSDCVFENNVSGRKVTWEQGNGMTWEYWTDASGTAAVKAAGGTFSARSCVFTGNASLNGGVSDEGTMYLDEYGNSGAVFLERVSGASLDSCVFTANQGGSAGSVLLLGTSAALSGCRFLGGYSATGAADAAALYQYDWYGEGYGDTPSALTMTNCLLFAGRSPAGTSALRIGYGCTGAAVHCTVSTAAQTPSTGVEGTLTLLNSIVAGTVRTGWSASVTASGCCLDEPLTGTGNICADPKLTGGGMLTAASPCIDAGQPAAGLPSADILGAARPQGTAPDIGYQEFADADGDGIPDSVEGAGGLAPLADPDGDGLDNLSEYQSGTHPRQADTDGDGIADGAELAAGGNPLIPTRVYYADPVSGNDSTGSGLAPGDAVRSIGAALALAGNSCLDVAVMLAPGVYSGPSNRALDFNGFDRRIIGVSAASCAVDLDGAGSFLRLHGGESRASRLQGLTVRNGYAGTLGTAVTVENSALTVRGCVFSCNASGRRETSTDWDGSTDVYYSGGDATASIVAIRSRLDLVDTRFESNTSRGSDMSGSYEYGLYGNCGAVCLAGGEASLTRCIFADNAGDSCGGVMAYGCRVVFTDCRFSGNVSRTFGGAVRTAGFSWYSQTTGESAWLESSVSLVNSLFVGNSSRNGGDDLAADYGGPVSLLHCTLAGGEGRNVSVLALGDAATVRNCIVRGSAELRWNGSLAASGNCTADDWSAYGTGNMAADPRLTGSGMLTAASPCIDAGTAVSGLPSADILGAARPQGTAPDIGCQEFADADGDGIPDSVEGTDGLVPGADADGDGLDNLAEYLSGTDPRLSDTDGDGLDDAAELAAGFNPLRTTRIVHVSPSGDDIHDGLTASLPKGTLRGAVAACVGRTGEQAVMAAPGTYAGEGSRGLDFDGTDVKLISAGGPESASVDLEGNGPFLRLHSGETLDSRLEGFTVRNGRTSEGGIAVDLSGASLDIRNCVFENCHAGRKVAWDAGDGKMTESWTEAGGTAAVRAAGAPIRISGTVFSSNDSHGDRYYQENDTGNAGALVLTRSTGTSVTDTVFAGNCGAEAGAVLLDAATASFTACRFTGNFSRSSGGALHACTQWTWDPYASTDTRLPGGVTAARCLFNGNRASFSGSSVCLESGTSGVFRHCTELSGRSRDGSALRSWGTVVMTDCIASGALVNDGGLPLSASHCRLPSGTAHEGTGNITADPVLTRGGLLMGTSPCAGAGTIATAAVADLFGNPCPAGTASDMGCHQFTDTDGDGIPDFLEDAAGLDPLDAADANGDTDGDGLSNLREYGLGTDIACGDTDGDGLGDGDELAQGRDPLLPARTVFVSPAGSDLADGLAPSSAKRTLAAAVDAAMSAGSENIVLAAPGTYSGEGCRGLDFCGYDIRLEAVSAGTAIVDLAGGCPFLALHSGETHASCIRGFSFVRGRGTEPAVSLDGADLTVADCSFRGFGHTGDDEAFLYWDGDPPAGILRLRTSSCRLRRSEISGCAYSPDCALIAVEDGELELDGCRLTGNSSGYDALIRCSDSRVRMTNTMVAHNNTASSGGVVRLDADSSLGLVNCTFSGNAPSFAASVEGGSAEMLNTVFRERLSGCRVSMSYCLVSEEYADPAAHCLAADPGLAGGLFLTAGSPCIDAGTREGAPDADLAGTLRPQGGGTDIGCEEYADLDGDGLSDFYAVWCGGGLTPAGDPDGDGLDNLTEMRLGTDAGNPDTDGDGMPDGWEVSNGLDPTTCDALEDPDGDGLENLAEYRAGTEARNPDTDGDGRDDGWEVRTAFSDPAAPDFDGGVTAVASLAGSLFTDSGGSWEADAGGARARGRSGWLLYSVPVRDDGVYMLELNVSEAGMSSAGPFSVSCRIDGASCCTGLRIPLDSSLSGTGTCMTPFLRAGLHTVRIEWDNVYRGTSLRLDSLRLLALSGPDSDGDGIPDWTETRLEHMACAVLPARSRVSPVCIEGENASFAETVAVSGYYVAPGADDPHPPVRRIAGNRWYADLPLNPDGATPVTVTVTSQNSAVTVSSSILWEPVDTVSLSEDTVRLGDEMLLGATLPAGVQDWTLTVGGVSSQMARGGILRHRFCAAGDVAVTASWRNADGTESVSEATVHVRGASFGGSLVCHAGTERCWRIPGIGGDIRVEIDREVQSFDIGCYGGARLLFVRGEMPATAYASARLYEDGPVLDAAEIHVIETSTHVGDGYHRVIADFGDGTVLYDGYVVAGQVVEGMSVTVTLWGTNSTFEDGTQEKTFTWENFDAAGELHFSILGGRSFTTCMTVILYQDGEEVWRLQ